MTAQPHDVNQLSERDLIVMTVERVGGLKESFEEFREETRGNFSRQEEAAKEMRAEFKVEVASLREETRTGYQSLDGRVSVIEKDLAAQAGAVKFGKWLWGAVVALIGLAGTIVGRWMQ